ncbi:MAG: hypothetical protein ACI4XJ_05870 [Eubacteriales bacterium]
MKNFKKVFVGILAAITLILPVSAAGATGNDSVMASSGKCPGCGKYTAAVTCSGSTAYTVSSICSDSSHGDCTKYIRYCYNFNGCTNCDYHTLSGTHSCIERHESEYGTDMMSICPYLNY